MFHLFERSPRGGTEAFYGMSKLIFIQKLSDFEVRDFGLKMPKLRPFFLQKWHKMSQNVNFVSFL